jgi:nicotinamide riboside kinase
MRPFLEGDVASLAVIALVKKLPHKITCSAAEIEDDFVLRHSKASEAAQFDNFFGSIRGQHNYGFGRFDS